ncbi:hypothetical protein TWF225_001130 [Orbilia oligospora]|nr:hypothetical protein TWF225_001130 [Orbilia oligospora]KAF3235165.1 hypothetical protein TWF128_001919 [Orbilia oligospora]KAF3253598.1 hypothetical protein TWF217_007386 [Orbilia oligospora]KAF3286509.1 hypothetical protein TWF132_008794 [Orbilia oligospora]
MQRRVIFTLFVINCRVVQGQLEWNDFTNNFATDLAPLITLFGEQVTKQFLSESLTIWDNIIFAMAPLGLLTAVVSVIRVCGSASLRAFIGRAQEGPGVAEIELLSCTSETTAEIYNEGGIARVFGEPQILEVVVVKPKANSNNFEYDGGNDGPRITMLWDAIFQGVEKAAYHQTSSSGVPLNIDEIERVSRYHRPNLSLNAGIVRLPKSVTYLAAAIGIALQSGVLVFAALTVYVYPDSFVTAGFGGEDRPAETYTFALTLVGTVFVTFGLFLCAFLIERSSTEVRFRRNNTVEGKIYWIQPGGQKIGDQVFGSYIGSFSGPEYIVSTKSPHRNENFLWIAVTCSMLGFVAQFVGLRGMHASVTLAQIGATLVMTIIRAMLRTKRLDKSGDVISSLAVPGLDLDSPNQHPLIKDPKLLHGHELDLFTMQVHGITGVFVSADPESHFQRAMQIETGEKRNVGKLLLDARSRLAEYTGLPGVSRGRKKTLDPLETFFWDDLKVRDTAHKLQSAIEATFDIISKTRPLITGSLPREEDDWSFNLTTTDEQGGVNTWKVNFQHGKGASTAYKVPRGPQQLESVLGLWALTLTGFDAEQYHAFSFSLRSSRTRDSLRAVYATEVDGQEEGKFTQALLSRWVKGRFNLQHEEMTRKNRGYLSKWSGRQGAEHHVFGMPVSPADGHTLRVSFVHTDNSVLQMCSQDIFMLFLRSLLQSARGIGGKTTIRKGANEDDLGFENSTVEEIAESFEKAQLGSKEDAYLCIFTVLMDLRLIPGPSNIVSAVLDDLSVQDIHRRLSEVEDLLLSAIKYPGIIGAQEEATLTALGELYIASAKELNSDISRFGFEGLIKTLELYGSSRIIHQYAWIGLQIDIQTGTSVYKGRIMKTGLNMKALHELMSSPQNIIKMTKTNSYRLLKYLEQTTLDINGQDDLGMTALSWAARTGNYKVAKWLLNNNAMTEIQDVDMRTPLSYAAESGLHKIVKALVEPKTLNINAPSVKGKKTALMFAAENGHALSVRHLLQNVEVDVRAVDKDGNNALLLAAAGGHVGVIGQLKLDYATANKQLRTALHLASVGGFERAVDKLLIGIVGSGGNVDAADDGGHTALHLAAKGGHEKVVRLLLIQGAGCNIKNHNGQTALFLSLQSGSGYEGVVRLLLSNNCDLSLRTNEGKTIIEEAEEKGLLRLRDMVLDEQNKRRLAM